MKKSKGQTIDLLYTKKEEPKKTTTKKSKNKVKGKKIEKEVIDLDNEIIIGLTPKKEQTKKTTQKKSKTTKKTLQKENNKKQKSKTIKNRSNNKSTRKPKSKKKKIKNNKKTRIIIWTSITVLILAIIVGIVIGSKALIDNIFKIKQIVVLNNQKVSSEEIINLSTLIPQDSMFKITKETIKNNIKSNAYIEDVTIKRSINGTITLDIKERVPKYMLKFANAYVYINNQGYMLEISEIPLELPIITGFSTISEEIKTGNRLNLEDLDKLEDIIKVMESTQNNAVISIITEIDISDQSNYILKMESEGKVVQFGDATKINVKLGMIELLLDAEKGKRGEIYFQDDAKKAVFKEEVLR